MEKYCEFKNKVIGTKGCDLVALDPAAIIYTPKRLPQAFQTLMGTDPVEAIRSLIYGDILTRVEGCPIIYDETLTPTDNSEGAVIGSYGAGFQVYIRGGNLIYQFDLPQRFCKSKKMMALNKWDGGVVFLTKDNRIVFGNEVNGEYVPFNVVMHYTDPKLFDNKTDPTLNSIHLNLGEKDVVFPRVFVTEQYPDLQGIDMGGIISGHIDLLTQTASSVTFKVLDDCTGADITEASYEKTQVLSVTVEHDDGTNITTIVGTITNGIITISGTFATGDTITVLAGIETTADAGADITYYTGTAILDF